MYIIWHTLCRQHRLAGCDTFHCYQSSPAIVRSGFSRVSLTSEYLPIETQGSHVFWLDCGSGSLSSPRLRHFFFFVSPYLRNVASLVAGGLNVPCARYVVSRRGRAGTSSQVPLFHRGVMANQSDAKVSSPYAAKASAKASPPVDLRRTQEWRIVAPGCRLWLLCAEQGPDHLT